MAHVPRNEFTEIIDRARSGEFTRMETPVSGASLPNVRSAAIGRELPPLTPEERAELDARAAEIGIIAAPESAEGTNYPTLAEAAAAGAPVEQPRPVAAPSVALAPPPPYPGGSGGYPRLPDFSKPAVLHLGLGVIYLDGLEFPISPSDLAGFRAYAITVVHADLKARLDAALEQYVPAQREETKDEGAPAGDEAVQPVQEGTESSSVQPGQQE